MRRRKRILDANDGKGTPPPIASSEDTDEFIDLEEGDLGEEEGDKEAEEITEDIKVGTNIKFLFFLERPDIGYLLTSRKSKTLNWSRCY